MVGFNQALPYTRIVPWPGQGFVSDQWATSLPGPHILHLEAEGGPENSARTHLEP